MKTGLPKLPKTGIRRFILPLASCLLLLGLASFADHQHGSQDCTKVNVNIDDFSDYQFVSRKSVLAAVSPQGADEFVGRKLDQIHLKTLEEKIMQNPFVRQADAWFDMQGELNIDVKQRIPVMRVINPLNEAYYIDMEGKRMPLSTQYAAFVPMAVASSFGIEGNKDSIMHALDSSLFVLSQFMAKDSFTKALTGQISIDAANEFSITPRLGNFQIVLGDAADLDDKIARLKSFYRVTLPEVGWDTYKTISLKYKNQIIANR
jgi:cell division protein FtsQ